MLSDSPPDRDVIWSDERVQGASRFVQRLWRLINELAETGGTAAATRPAAFGADALALRKAAHGALDKVSTGIEKLHFNVCLAYIREFSNALGEVLARPATPSPDLAWAVREAAVILVQLFAPMMPHLAEECGACWGSPDWFPKRIGRKSNAICWLKTRDAGGSGQWQETGRGHGGRHRPRIRKLRLPFWLLMR